MRAFIFLYALNKVRDSIMRLTNKVYFSFSSIAAVIAFPGVFWSGTVSADPSVSFRLDVSPILQHHCVKCHKPNGPGYMASGLDLRSYESLMRGTKHGKIIVPGDPLTSNLMVLIEGRADPSIRMPHNERPLLKQQVEILNDWVKQGAKNN